MNHDEPMVTIEAWPRLGPYSTLASLVADRDAILAAVDPNATHPAPTVDLDIVALLLEIADRLPPLPLESPNQETER